MIYDIVMINDNITIFSVIENYVSIKLQFLK